MKILIHAPNWLGDHVMAFLFYGALKEIFRDDEIHLLGRSWVNHFLPQNIFDKVYTTKRSLLDAPLKEKLRKENFDLGISLSPSFRSIFTFYQIKIPLRIGYKTDMRRLFLKYPKATGSKRVPALNVHEHRSLSYLRLLTPYFRSDQVAEDYWLQFKRNPPAVAVEKNDRQNWQKLKQKHQVKKYVAICPGSVGPSKVYPMEYLAQVLENILDGDKSLQIVLVGSSIEQQYAQQLYVILNKKFHRRVIDLTAQTSLNEVFLCLQQAKGLIANDSGIAHISFLSQTPLVTFIGMARKEETLTLNNRKVVLNKNLSCSPCMQAKCPKTTGKIACLTSIAPQEVIDATKIFIK